MKHRQRLYFAGIIVLFFVLVFVYIKKFAIGTKWWVMSNEHELVEIYDTCPSGKYNNSYEMLFYGDEYGWCDPMGCFASIGFEYNQIFGDNCSFILYGTVLQCDNYAFTDKYDGNYDINFSCHTIKIRVEKDIYGNLKKGQEVYIFCRWKYSQKVIGEDYNSIGEGKKGIFIVTGIPIRLSYKDGNDIFAIGSMHNNKRFHYCMSDYDSGIDKLETKQDVINFWKENQWVY